MFTQTSIQEFSRFWNQSRLPIVFKRQRPAPLLVRLPFAPDNKVWLRNGERNKPSWNKEHDAWEVPQAWFERTITLAFTRYKSCYVIQLYREKEICAPACWNATGADCECSCMGANHSSNRPAGRWYEVNDAFAVMWGVQRYSVRRLREPSEHYPSYST